LAINQEFISLSHQQSEPLAPLAYSWIGRKVLRIFHTQAAGVLSSRFHNVKGFDLTFSHPDASLSHKFKINESDLQIEIGGNLRGMQSGFMNLPSAQRAGRIREFAETNFVPGASHH